MATTGTASWTPDLADIVDEASELWAAIPEFVGMYEVSSFGRVRSVARVVAGRDGPTNRLGCMLAIHPAGGRYLKVSLSREGKMHQMQVHRLVLLAFVGAPPTGFVCDHIDGDIRNNTLGNLRWLSHAENVRRKRTAKLTWDMVRGIRGKPSATLSDIATEYGISEGHVRQVRQHTRWEEPV